MFSCAITSFRMLMECCMINLPLSKLFFAGVSIKYRGIGGSRDGWVRLIRLK